MAKHSPPSLFFVTLPILYGIIKNLIHSTNDSMKRIIHNTIKIMHLNKQRRGNHLKMFHISKRREEGTKWEGPVAKNYVMVGVERERGEGGIRGAMSFMSVFFFTILIHFLGVRQTGEKNARMHFNQSQKIWNISYCARQASQRRKLINLYVWIWDDNFWHRDEKRECDAEGESKAREKCTILRPHMTT